MLKEVSILLNRLLCGAREPLCARIYANSIKHGSAWRAAEIAVNGMLWFWPNHCCDVYCRDQREKENANEQRSNPMRRHLTMCAVLLTLTVPSLAQEREVHQAVGTFCDTRELASQFLTEWNGTNTRAVLAEVNANAPMPNKCRVAHVFYVVVERHGIYQTPKGEWQVVKALVVGLSIRGQVIRPRAPTIWYSYATPNGSNV